MGKPGAHAYACMCTNAHVYVKVCVHVSGCACLCEYLYQVYMCYNYIGKYIYCKTEFVCSFRMVTCSTECLKYLFPTDYCLVLLVIKPYPCVSVSVYGGQNLLPLVYLHGRSKQTWKSHSLFAIAIKTPVDLWWIMHWSDPKTMIHKHFYVHYKPNTLKQLYALPTPHVSPPFWQSWCSFHIQSSPVFLCLRHMAVALAEAQSPHQYHLLTHCFGWVKMYNTKCDSDKK